MSIGQSLNEIARRQLLTAAQMRAVEDDATRSGAVTGLELMERAGRGAVDAILDHWPGRPGDTRNALVLCGPGNNGGDGFVVARLLAERGWGVDALLYGDPGKLKDDARTAHDRWRRAGGVRPLDRTTVPDHKATFGQTLREPDLIVDALFGTGLARPLEPELAALLHDLDLALREGRCGRVALDIPSGLCSDSGRVLGDDQGDGLPWHPDLTVTFHTMKPGHVLAAGPEWSGTLRIVDIGLDGTPPEGAASLARAEAWRLVKGHPDDGGAVAHKYDYGHALILSGGPGRGGAARMAARAALRIGAGLVTLGCPPGALQENASRLDAVMTRSVKGAGGLAAMLASDERLTAICLGPGFGVEAAREVVPLALEAKRPTVLDGDALTAFADHPQALFGALHEACVLTPHTGEFARLFPNLAQKIAGVPNDGPAQSKIDVVREAAALTGCIVLLKGADTVIAAPDGEAAVNAAHYDRAVPWLATAGAGDVLAGFVTGLIARGHRPFQAACDAAWLHVECARRFGPGLIAEDLPDLLPSVLRDLAADE